MRRRYIQGFVLAASCAGLGVSAYLTSVHFAASQLVCAVAGPVNCERVLSSAYAVVAGSPFPTSAAGIAWFGVSAVLATAMWLGMKRLGPLQVAWSALGLLSVVYLVFVEIVLLGAICIWCSVVHVLVVLIFLATVTVRPVDLEPGR